MAISNPVPFTVLSSSEVDGTGIVVELFDQALNRLGVLHDSYGRGWVDVLDEPGAATVTIPDGHPLATDTALAYGHLLRWSLDGNRRFVSTIRDRSRSVADEAKPGWTITGPGAPGWLRRCRVYPEGPLETQTRPFTFASSYYSISGWDPAVEVAVTPGYPDEATQPTDWPAARNSTPYIWTEHQDGNGDHPAGTCFFATDIVVTPSDLSPTGRARVRITWAADDEVQGWLATHRFADVTGEYQWQRARTFEAELAAGTYRLGWQVRNLARPPAGGNPGWLRYVVEVMASSTTAARLVAESDDTVAALGYPDEVPGLNPGEVMTILVDEANDRGCAIPFGQGWTSTHDSGAVPWTASDLAFQVGDGYDAVLDQLIEGDIECYRVDPDTFGLQLFQHRSVDRSAGTSPVIFRPGYNLDSYDVDGTEPEATALLVDVGGRLEARDDTVAQAAHGRIEGGVLRLPQSPSTSYVGRTVTSLFDKLGLPQDRVTGTLVAVAGAEAYRDWWPGVWVQAPDGWSPGLVARRVRAVAVTDDGDSVKVTPELSTLYQERVRMHDRWLARMAPGALGGWSSRAS